MKIKDGYELRALADKYIVIAKSESNLNLTSMITLNKSGKFLFESLKENKTVEELVNLLVNKYDISEDIAKSDVLAFINILKANNLLEGE